MSYSATLQGKIDRFKAKAVVRQVGELQFHSPLILAPMASIGTAPFRLAMEELGAGATVSELISSSGILHGNHKTLEMLRIHPQEKMVGIQLFGSDGDELAKASEVAQKFGPRFIDINMGCPVKKVICKGAGAALLEKPKELIPFLRTLKSALSVPLTIKIRLGPTQDHQTAEEILSIAYDQGVNMVAIHGRTRAQGYSGLANWDEIARLSRNTPMPVIGNGDLTQPTAVFKQEQKKECAALMIGRGCLRNPFLFLESLLSPDEEGEKFTANDYFEVILRLKNLMENHFDRESTLFIQMRKHVMWFAAGLPDAARFRSGLFGLSTTSELMEYAQNYFGLLGEQIKFIDHNNEVFMTSGHG